MGIECVSDLNITVSRHFFDHFHWNSAIDSHFGFWLFVVLYTDFHRKIAMFREPRQWRPFRLQGLQHQSNADVHAVNRGANRSGTTRTGRFLDFGKYPYFYVEFQTATTPPLLLQIDRELLQNQQTGPALHDPVAQSTIPANLDHRSSTSGNGQNRPIWTGMDLSALVTATAAHARPGETVKNISIEMTSGEALSFFDFLVSLWCVLCFGQKRSKRPRKVVRSWRPEFGSKSG